MMSVDFDFSRQTHLEPTIKYYVNTGDFGGARIVADGTGYSTMPDELIARVLHDNILNEKHIPYIGKGDIRSRIQKTTFIDTDCPYVGRWGRFTLDPEGKFLLPEQSRQRLILISDLVVDGWVVMAHRQRTDFVVESKTLIKVFRIEKITSLEAQGSVVYFGSIDDAFERFLSPEMYYSLSRIKEIISGSPIKKWSSLF